MSAKDVQVMPSGIPLTTAAVHSTSGDAQRSYIVKLREVHFRDSEKLLAIATKGVL